MLLFGHPRITNDKFYHVNSIEAIAHTPSNTCVLFTYNDEVFELIEHARENDLPFALDISSLREAIICENLDASYLLVNDEIATSVQKAADTYLFDAKVLVHIKDEEAIEALAEEGIDGVVFSQAIIKIS
jgi:hypothetical protein